MESKTISLPEAEYPTLTVMIQVNKEESLECTFNKHFSEQDQKMSLSLVSVNRKCKRFCPCVIYLGMVALLFKTMHDIRYLEAPAKRQSASPVPAVPLSLKAAISANYVLSEWCAMSMGSFSQSLKLSVPSARASAARGLLLDTPLCTEAATIHEIKHYWWETAIIL